MTTRHIQLIWDCGCAGTAQTSSGSCIHVGPAGRWTAEELLVAAEESAVMSSFVALAESEGLEVLGYVSSAAMADGEGSDIAVAVRPCIVVAREADRARARDLLTRAVEGSPVCRALGGALRVDPDVVVIGSS